MEYAELEFVMRMYDSSSQLDNFKRELLRMSPENLNKILLLHADAHLKDANGAYNLRGFMNLAVIARALNEGKNEAFIESLYGKNDFASNLRKQLIRNIQDEHVIHTEKHVSEQGKQDESFAQTSSLRLEDLPLHGWKYHISASTMDEYHLTCALVVPELEALGVPFKMTQVEKFEEQLNSDQHGKLLTLYPPFDISKLSKAAQDFLYNKPSPELAQACEALNKHAVVMGETTRVFNPISNNIISPHGDMNIAGRVFARYGRFRPSCVPDQNNPDARINYVTSPDGKAQLDPKYQREYKPDFVVTSKPEDILNFYSNIENKYVATGDRKTYMQEYFTMCECGGKSHAYMIFEMNPCDMGVVHQALFSGNDPYGLSFVAKGPDDGKSYLFLHPTAVPYYNNIQAYAMQNSGQMFTRPEWDIKKTVYEFHPSQIESAKQMAQKINAEYNFGAAVQILQTKNGKCFIQCDSSFDNIMKDSCREFQIGIREASTKSPLCAFYEKLTGKDLTHAQDITYDAPIRNMDNAR